MKLQGTRKEYRGPAIRLTTLTPIEEATNPPDPPDPVNEMTDQPHQFTSEEFAKPVDPNSGMTKEKRRGRPSPEEKEIYPFSAPSTIPTEVNPSMPKETTNGLHEALGRRPPAEKGSPLHYGALPEDSRQPNLDLPERTQMAPEQRYPPSTVQLDSNTKRKLRGINPIRRKLLSLFKTRALNEEFHNEPYSFYQNKEEFDINRLDNAQPERDNDEEKSSSRESKEKPFPNESPKLLTPERLVSRKETSGSSEINTGVRPERRKPLEIRWDVAHARTKRDDNRRYRIKRKKKAKDPSKSNAPIIVAGIAAGILVLLSIVTGVFQLW